MGAKGYKVQKIKTDFNVTIKIPYQRKGNKSSNPNIIHIRGKLESCKAAWNALFELVPITVEVTLPSEFRQYIIGQNDFSDIMKKFEVNIRVPSQDTNSNIIIIYGAPKNVDAAKIGLAEKVTEFEAKKKEDKKEKKNKKDKKKKDDKIKKGDNMKNDENLNKVVKDKKEYQYQCFVCRKRWSCRSRLGNHLSTSHGFQGKLLKLTDMYVREGNSFKCCKCDSSIATKKGVALHLGSSHKLIYTLIKPSQTEPMEIGSDLVPSHSRSFLSQGDISPLQVPLPKGQKSRTGEQNSLIEGQYFPPAIPESPIMKKLSLLDISVKRIKLN